MLLLAIFLYPLSCNTQRDVQYVVRTGNESEKKWKLKLTLTILKLLNGDAVYILP